MVDPLYIHVSCFIPPSKTYAQVVSSTATPGTRNPIQSQLKPFGTPDLSTGSALAKDPSSLCFQLGFGGEPLRKPKLRPSYLEIRAISALLNL